jgi:hypothetical protein
LEIAWLNWLRKLHQGDEKVSSIRFEADFSHGYAWIKAAGFDCPGGGHSAIFLFVFQ